ncbi:MAG: hypothetical protein FWG43_06270, partial [Clostridiales bacterium]|nr:hypothetical protein [Clostridiales bacterium]
TSNTSWEISKPFWLDTTANSGSGNGSFTLTATANTSADIRSGLVLVWGGGIAQSFSVTQLGTSTGAIILTLDTPATVAITAGGRREVMFTAPSTGTYYFESANRGSLDPKAYTASSGTGMLDDDSGPDGRNYKFLRTLSAGQTFTYYSGVYNDATVSGNYTVTVTSTSANAITLTLDTPAAVAITAGGRREIKFTAPVNDIYYFESSNRGSLDPKAYSASSGTGMLDDDSGPDGRNYKFPQTLNAGQIFTYYSGVYGDANVSGNYTVTVTSVAHPTVSLITPSANTSTTGSTISINASGTNCAKIEAYVNNALVATANSNSLSYSYPIKENGAHNIYVKGYGNAGSSVISVTPPLRTVTVYSDLRIDRPGDTVFALVGEAVPLSAFSTRAKSIDVYIPAGSVMPYLALTPQSPSNVFSGIWTPTASNRYKALNSNNMGFRQMKFSTNTPYSTSDSSRNYAVLSMNSKSDYQKIQPSLNWSSPTSTPFLAPYTDAYNCLAYAVDITGSWIDTGKNGGPQDNAVDVEKFMRGIEKYEDRAGTKYSGLCLYNEYPAAIYYKYYHFAKVVAWNADGTPRTIEYKMGKAELIRTSGYNIYSGYPDGYGEPVRYFKK